MHACTHPCQAYVHQVVPAPHPSSTGDSVVQLKLSEPHSCPHRFHRSQVQREKKGFKKLLKSSHKPNSRQHCTPQYVLVTKETAFTGSPCCHLQHPPILPIQMPIHAFEPHQRSQDHPAHAQVVFLHFAPCCPHPSQARARIPVSFITDPNRAMEPLSEQHNCPTATAPGPSVKHRYAPPCSLPAAYAAAPVRFQWTR
jgi:hypothetical protein